MRSTQSVVTRLHLALFAGASAAFLAAPVHAVVVTVNPVTPITIPDSSATLGLYLNVITGLTGTSGGAVPGWDINPYNNTTGLTFYGAASPSGILATGVAGTTAVAQLLGPGSVVSATPAAGGFYNQFQTTGTGGFQASGDHYLGFRFSNDAATPVIYYGWMLIRSGNVGGGFPAAIVRYAYENTGLAITVPVPEASTYAMMGLGLAGIAGLSAYRRRRAA